MKYNNVTIIDIAKALGISKSTVSRALKNSYDVNEATKQKVQNFAKEHNYEPNLAARGLRQLQTFSVGVVVPELKNNFFAQVIEGIDEYMYPKGYQIIIAQSYEQVEREIEATKHLANRGIDGLIVSVSAKTKNYDHYKQLQKRGMPIAFFDRVPEDFQTHKVIIDNMQVAFKATEMLIKKGRKRILHIIHSPNLSISQERLKGYRAAVEKHGIKYDEKLIYYCDYASTEIAAIEKDLQQYFKLKQKPDAVFSSGDRITSIIYGCLQRLQILVPEHILFVGFSNNTMIDVLNPHIMVVRQPAFEMGMAAAQLLVQLIESKKPTKVFEQRVLHPIIVDHQQQT